MASKEIVEAHSVLPGTLMYVNGKNKWFVVKSCERVTNWDNLLIIFKFYDSRGEVMARADESFHVITNLSSFEKLVYGFKYEI